MRFSTIFTVLAAGAMAFASAVPDIVTKRSNTEIKNAFNDLNNKCDTAILKFDDCHDDTCSALICAELIVAIDDCNTLVGGLTGGLGTLVVAHAVADVVIKVAVGLDNHKTQCGSGCPGLIDIYADVDLSLKVCLQTVFNKCSGLLALVTGLLLGLLATLQGIWFTLVISVCNLL